MTIDYIWRDNTNGMIVLAVEHENQEANIKTLLSSELRHLADLKAEYKIAMMYPSYGDLETLLHDFAAMLQRNYYHVTIGQTPVEQYLVITGHSTTKERKPAIEFKANRFRSDGAREAMESRVVFQRV